MTCARHGHDQSGLVKLVGSSATLSGAETKELYVLIDAQTDRLARLVNNLLDMTRIEAGVLEVRRLPRIGPRSGHRDPHRDEALTG
jgi:signal transduction histidine kinase